MTGFLVCLSEIGVWRTIVRIMPPLNSEWVPIMDRILPENPMRNHGEGSGEAIRGGLGDQRPRLYGSFHVKARTLTIPWTSPSAATFFQMVGIPPSLSQYRSTCRRSPSRGATI
jgi:hypothetical protein